MRAECVPWNCLAADDIPLEPPYDGIQVPAQLRPEPQRVWNPTDDSGDVLQSMRTDSDAKRTGMMVDRRYPPGHQRQSAAFSADFEIVTNPFEPFAKPAFKNPAAEIANFVVRIRSRPGMDGITCTERMTELEVSRSRDSAPDFLRRCRDSSLDGHGPFETGSGVLRRRSRGRVRLHSASHGPDRR